MKNQKGFSLVELLVVVIIIAIIAAIAIPNLLASRRAANEASAISTLRTTHSAQATYQATTGGGTQYASAYTGLTNLVDSVLAGSANPAKSGYNFTLNTGTGNVIYCATGAPQDVTTGTRIFGVESDGVVYQITAANQCASGNLSTDVGSATPL